MLLEVKGLSKSFGTTTVFDGLSLSVEPRNMLFLTGPSGCGKSTALRLIANLDAPDSGHVLLDNQEASLFGFAAWRTLITYVPQSRTNIVGSPIDLFREVLKLSARQQPAVSAKLSPYLRSRMSDARNVSLEGFIAVAQSVGLHEEQVNQSWAELSGGQAQRASVSMAIATCPAVLLLDESTSSCDMDSTYLVEEAVKKSGATVVWVSHDPTQPERVGGRVFSFANTV